MSVDRYPADLALTSQDFAECGWKEALASARREDYSSKWQAFSAAAKKAVDEGRLSHGKALWLLSDACSMALKSESFNEPYKPVWVWEGKRSIIPDDLLDSDIAFYAEIVDEVDDPWLKARLADLVWLRRKPRDPQYAVAAIDAYRSIPLDMKTWMRGARNCWERAIGLSRLLKEGAGNRLTEIEAAIYSAFAASSREDVFLALWLANLLFFNDLGRSHREAIAQKLEMMARTFEGDGDLHRAREYFRASNDWFNAVGDKAKSAEMTVALAEGWVKEAVARISSDNPSHMVAATFYENAIQTYRNIPRSDRALHQVDERIAELRGQLAVTGEKAIGEMQVISTPGVDIREVVENARNSVRGKDPIEALKAFANLHQGPNVKQLRENAIDGIRKYPMQSLFGATIMSRDGRVIAKRPGMSLGGTPSEEDEIVIREAMIREFGIEMNIVVHGDILPAHEVLLSEHRLREADFITLASQSPIVPMGRERLFGKALYSGYDRDFDTALHLLVPQIENMVRFHLKQAGAKTTTLDTNGIENENALGTLMELPEAKKVFGENLSFEFKALFCDPFGPNLRNELAHGLLGDDSGWSIPSVYAWWLGLRLVFNAYWNRARKSIESGEEDVKE